MTPGELHAELDAIVRTAFPHAGVVVTSLGDGVEIEVGMRFVAAMKITTGALEEVDPQVLLALTGPALIAKLSEGLQELAAADRDRTGFRSPCPKCGAPLRCPCEAEPPVWAPTA